MTCLRPHSQDSRSGSSSYRPEHIRSAEEAPLLSSFGPKPNPNPSTQGQELLPVLFPCTSQHPKGRHLSMTPLSGSGQCATMELGPLEGGYLELLNSDVDPLHHYHLYDQMDLAGEQEIELYSGEHSSLWPLPPLPTCRGLQTAPRANAGLQTGQHHEQLSCLRGDALRARVSPSPGLPLPPSHQPSSQISPASYKERFLQSLTWTPSTVTSSAGCYTTWKGKKRLEIRTPTLVRAHSGPGTRTTQGKGSFLSF